MKTNFKNIIYTCCLISFICTGCVKELIEEDVSISSVNFIDASTAEINTDWEMLEDYETMNVLAVNHFNDSLTFEGFSELPVRVSDLPEGYVYTFHLQLQRDNKRKTQRTEFGPPGVPTLASNNQDTNIDRIDLLQQINKVRQTEQTCNGNLVEAVAPLIWNDLLEDAAKLHSIDMASNNFFEGVNPETGVSVFDQVTKVNYPHTNISSQLGKGYNSPEAAINGWIGNSRICESIMNPDLKEIGTFKQADYWTQLIGSR